MIYLPRGNFAAFQQDSLEDDSISHEVHVNGVDYNSIFSGKKYVSIWKFLGVMKQKRALIKNLVTTQRDAGDWELK